ncbi:hypothetical protein LCGC14_0246020 [marine sediment metagenome]|uniref:Uncharacterized protein n=1 Tax=marine sediment metagenome TaxID=412755 RepID=A0A0F9WR42_9ZZZZ
MNSIGKPRKDVFWKDVPEKEKYQFLPNTYADQFSHIFGTSPKKYEDRSISMIELQYRLDLLKFDAEFLEVKFPNYIKDETSMKALILREYGEDAGKLVEILANIKGN